MTDKTLANTIARFALQVEAGVDQSTNKPTLALGPMLKKLDDMIKLIGQDPRKAEQYAQALRKEMARMASVKDAGLNRNITRLVSDLYSAKDNIYRELQRYGLGGAFYGAFEDFNDAISIFVDELEDAESEI